LSGITALQDLHKALEEKEESVQDVGFKGSQVWFERFQQVKFSAKPKAYGEPASADGQIMAVFLSDLQQIIDKT
jgi:hypothetical protein